MQYTINGVLRYYFAKVIYKQKVEIDSILFILLLLICNC